MPYAVHATCALTATAFAKSFHPNPAPDIIVAEPVWACSAREQPVSDSEPQHHETDTELASANRAAFLSASIAEINQPISAVVMNAEAALRLLLAQPTDTEAVRRLLGCIVNDGMRSGDIVNRTRALVKKAPRKQP
jgi:C4-dicarboxylate-specific signal transduction histidine kinase